MFSLGRLITLALVGTFVYVGFFQLPSGGAADGQFDPDRLAVEEVNLWRAAKIQDEVSTFTSAVVVLREQHRYSWFRAAQAGFYMARAASTFSTLKTRYERVLPDLEEAAAIHKAWTNASFEPAAVARAQLNWWVTKQLPNLNTIDQVAPLVSEEFELRYGLPAGAASGAAVRRAEAALLFETGGRDPNIGAVTKALADSNLMLQRVINSNRNRTR